MTVNYAINVWFKDACGRPMAWNNTNKKLHSDKTIVKSPLEKMEKQHSEKNLFFPFRSKLFSKIVPGTITSIN